MNQKKSTYKRITPDIKHIPYFWDLRINNSTTSSPADRLKSICRICNDNKGSNDFNRRNVYASVVSHETIHMLWSNRLLRI